MNFIYKDWRNFTSVDLKESVLAGASLNQWLYGYFENFALYGHNCNKKILDELESKRREKPHIDLLQGS